MEDMQFERLVKDRKELEAYFLNLDREWALALFKTLVLINGGALLGVLGVLGTGKLTAEFANACVYGAIGFSVGLLLVCIAGVVRSVGTAVGTYQIQYLTSIAYSKAHYKDDKDMTNRLKKVGAKANKRYELTGKVTDFFSQAGFVLSVVSFGSGAFAMAKVLENYYPSGG